MKNTNNKWSKRVAAAALGLFAVALVITLTGCGEENKSSKAKSNNNFGVGGVGGNVPGGSNVLYSGLGNTSSYSSNGKVQAALDFYIAQNGGVVAQGEMYSLVYAPTYGCGIPVGNYTITTEQPGSIDNYSGSVAGVRVIANGPVQIRMTIHDARFFQATPFRRACNNELFASDMYAYVSIDSVNNQFCSGVVTFVYNQNFTCNNQ